MKVDSETYDNCLEFINKHLVFVFYLEQQHLFISEIIVTQAVKHFIYVAHQGFLLHAALVMLPSS